MTSFFDIFYSLKNIKIIKEIFIIFLLLFSIASSSAQTLKRSEEIVEIQIAFSDLNLNFDYQKYFLYDKKFIHDYNSCTKYFGVIGCDPIINLINHLKSRISSSRGEKREEYQNDLYNLVNESVNFINSKIEFDTAKIQPSKGNLNVIYNGAVAINTRGKQNSKNLKYCFLKFSVYNGLEHDLSSNSIILTLTGGNLNSDLENFPLRINFKKLASGDMVQKWFPAFLTNSHHTSCEYKNMFQSTSTAFPFNQILVGIDNIRTAFSDGFTTTSKLTFINAGPDSFKPKVFIHASLAEGIKRQNPTYNAKAIRNESCRARCQQLLETCVIENRPYANQVCGLPNAQCFKNCE